MFHRIFFKKHRKTSMCANTQARMAIHPCPNSLGWKFGEPEINCFGYSFGALFWVFP